MDKESWAIVKPNEDLASFGGRVLHESEEEAGYYLSSEKCNSYTKDYRVERLRVTVITESIHDFIDWNDDQVCQDCGYLLGCTEACCFKRKDSCKKQWSNLLAAPVVKT